MVCFQWVVVFSNVLFCTVWTLGLQPVSNYGIYGGHDVSIEEVPYMVGIYYSQFLIWFYKCHCGGSIIHERFVLTAAHCVEGYYSIKVGVGSDHLDKGELISVDLRITRNDYDGNQLHNDIALLKLSKSLQFGPKVAPVRLPNEGYEIPQGALANVTGWGETEKKTGQASTLRQVTIPILPKWYCRVKQICAGGPGLGTCNGDSGGPLVYNNMVIGVVSFRRQDSCAGPFGTVYVDVASYSNWIKMHLL